MSKKTLGAVVIALALLWSGAAFGQGLSGSPCGDSTFAKQVTFPYLTGSGGFMSGVALMNLTETDITPANLCFVAQTMAGDVLQAQGSTTGLFPDTQAGAKGIEGGGLYVFSTDTLADAKNDPKWRNALIMSVYTRNAQLNNIGALRGFAMLGDGTQAHAYNALNRNEVENPGNVVVDDGNGGAPYLLFDYTPSRDSEWFTGMAIYNAGGDTRITGTIYYQDGTESVIDRTELKAGRMLIGQLSSPNRSERIFPDADFNPAKASRVVISTTGVEQGVPRLHGFAFFGDGTMGQGMLPVYSTEDNRPTP